MATDNSNNDKIADTPLEERVFEICRNLINTGQKPTVREVRRLSGGNNAAVSEAITNFNRQQEAEEESLANEIGSSEIGRLIASQIRQIVSQKTEDKQNRIQDLKFQIDDKDQTMVELEKESSELVDKANQEKDAALAKIDEAMNAKSKALKELEDIKQETTAAIDKLNSSTELKIQAEKDTAKALVDQANQRVQDTEAETKLLRKQVKDLTVDEAKRKLEQEELANSKHNLSDLQTKYSDLNTQLLIANSEKKAIQGSLEKMELAIDEFKDTAKELAAAQAQQVEMQKQISQLQSELSLAQRERDSLSQALAYNQGEKKFKDNK